MHPMLNIAIEAARNAAKVLFRFIDRLDQLQVTQKQNNELVSQADHMAESVILEIIRKTYPNHGIITEEAGETAGDDCCWIIDPLDGTTNFVHGFMHFAISIAMTHRGQLEVAVVYDPIRQELFTASRGQGAQVNQKRMRVSNTAKLQQSLIGTGFPYRNQENLDTYLRTFSTIFPQVHGIRRAGSAALDLAYVAAGRLDGFWEANLKAWDMAAGALLIKEAGGLLSDFQGQQNYLQNGNIIGGNPKIYKQLASIIE